MACSFEFIPQDATLIGGGGIFGQCMESTSTRRSQELRLLLICAGNSGQNVKNGYGSTLSPHVISKLTLRSFTTVYEQMGKASAVD